jgi:hypothetical protein
MKRAILITVLLNGSGPHGRQLIFNLPGAFALVSFGELRLLNFPAQGI